MSKKQRDAWSRFQNDRDKMRAEMESIRAEQDKRYKDILTDEQYKKYLDNREQLRGQQGRRRNR